MRICEKRGLRYLVLDVNGFVLTSSSPYITFFFRLLPFAVLGLQKIQTWLGIGKNIAERERLIGRLLRLVSFGQLYAPVYVTIAGAMDLVFCGMYKKSTVYDLQHGVIYSEQVGYFEKKCLREHLNYPNIHFLVYGAGFKKIFTDSRGSDCSLLPERVHIVGDVLRADQKRLLLGLDRTVIFCSLQLVPDFSADELDEMKEIWVKFLEDCERLGVSRRLRIVFKHHPRFANCISFSEINNRFPFLEWCNDINAVAANMLLHVTIFSTVAFDVASMGIPTCFLNGMNRITGSKLFQDEFKYPFNRSFKEWVDRYEKDRVGYDADSDLIKEWFLRFYDKMNETQISKLMQGDI